MKVSDLLEELAKLIEEDESVLDLRVTLAGLEYSCSNLEVRPTWDESENVLDIY